MTLKILQTRQNSVSTIGGSQPTARTAPSVASESVSDPALEEVDDTLSTVVVLMPEESGGVRKHVSPLEQERIDAELLRYTSICRATEVHIH